MYATHTPVKTAGPRPRHRGVWETSKDARADAAVRLATVRERHGAGAVDLIEATSDGFKTTVDDLYGAGLVELARAVHRHGRLRKISDSSWVVFKS